MPRAALFLCRCRHHRWHAGAAWTIAAIFWACLAAAADLPENRLLEFDIPAQPLAAALNRYGEIALVPALYPSDLPAGLYSTPVQGLYSRVEALRRLLQGTGLSLDKMATAHGEVFRLTRTRAAPSPGAVEPERWGSTQGGYLPILQAGVMQALCVNARTAPGHYRAMFQISIDATGRADTAALVSSSGNARRDAALLAVLHQVRTSAPPTASVRVPYLFTLRPSAPGSASPCPASARGAP